MKPLDISQLVDWLGLEGAVSGLERSKLTNAELMVVARENGLKILPKSTRKNIIIELVMSPIKRIDKSVEFLLSMSADELKRYFSDVMVSDTEISSLLDDLGIAPSGKVKGKLSEYAAREISELGLFQRVAKGHGYPTSKNGEG